ncbi:hypothetical protein AB1Y20_022090 [Prymnesium parvum]|uniref:PH domain-containing protein n=1 Tax=Prymnesium parvum TaxID=97485 RepID=A0AB34JGA3_PRYPA
MFELRSYSQGADGYAVAAAALASAATKANEEEGDEWVREVRRQAERVQTEAVEKAHQLCLEEVGRACHMLSEQMQQIVSPMGESLRKLQQEQARLRARTEQDKLRPCLDKMATTQQWLHDQLSELQAMCAKAQNSRPSAASPGSTSPPRHFAAAGYAHASRPAPTTYPDALGRMMPLTPAPRGIRRLKDGGPRTVAAFDVVLGQTVSSQPESPRGYVPPQISTVESVVDHSLSSQVKQRGRPPARASPETAGELEGVVGQKFAMSARSTALSPRPASASRVVPPCTIPVRMVRGDSDNTPSRASSARRGRDMCRGSSGFAALRTRAPSALLQEGCNSARSPNSALRAQLLLVGTFPDPPAAAANATAAQEQTPFISFQNYSRSGDPFNASSAQRRTHAVGYVPSARHRAEINDADRFPNSIFYSRDKLDTMRAKEQNAFAGLDADLAGSKGDFLVKINSGRSRANARISSRQARARW